MEETVATPKDKQVLSYVLENYSCKICSNMLIQCVTLSCGHHCCSYCLDLLGEMSRRCPQCSSSIKSATPNPSIDQQVDSLIHSCSKPVQEAYIQNLDSRFKKCLDRGKASSNHLPRSSSRSLDELQNSDHCVAKAFKSARKSQASTSTPKSGRPSARGGGEKKTCAIDGNKVDSLFGIYDHVLTIDNEPRKELAGGDCCSPADLATNVTSESMENFRRRSDAELSSLIREADDIIQLDSEIQKWTRKMTDSLSNRGDTSKDSADPVERELHEIDDQLWKASSELLRRLRGMQQQRQQQAPVTNEILKSFFLPSPPVPRSEKLKLEEISDASDAEEYSEALNNLQECLEPPVGLQNQERAEQTTCPSKKQSVLDLIEESGNDYVKNNINFITQIRKYKGALMKIHNHEVETAEEIKQLLPERRFVQEDMPVDRRSFKCETPRRPPPHHSHSSGSRQPRQMHSARLEPVGILPPRRPTTASYDLPSSTASHQLVPNQAQAPHHSHSLLQSTKQYRKRVGKNPFYTAR